jgi:hypothetical protein
VGPYPDNEEPPDVERRGRSGIIIALVIAAVVLVVVVVHLTGGMALHSP